MPIQVRSVSSTEVIEVASMDDIASIEAKITELQGGQASLSTQVGTIEHTLLAIQDAIAQLGSTPSPAPGPAPAPSPSPTPEPPPPTGEGPFARLGASFIPTWAPPPYSGPPANALDRADFSSTSEWLDECERQGLPGKIGPGRYNLNTRTQHKCSIYGYGDTKPIFVGTGVGLYLGASGLTFQNLQWEGFAYAIVSVDDWDDWNSFGVSSNWNNRLLGADKRGQDPNRAHNDNLSKLTVLDCRFDSVGVAINIIRQNYTVANVTVGRCYSEDGKGFFYLAAHDFGAIDIFQNVHRNHAQGSAKGQNVGTLYLLGTNRTDTIDQNGLVRLMNFEAYKCTSTHTHSKKNGSTVFDVRDCQFEIADFIAEDCTNDAGHADAQMGYAKGRGVIERFRARRCGSMYVNDNNLGSEGQFLTLKGGDGPTIVRHFDVDHDGMKGSGFLSSHETLFEEGTVYNSEEDQHEHRDSEFRSYSGGPHLLRNIQLLKFRNRYAIEMNNNAKAENIFVETTRTDVMKGVETTDCKNSNGDPL